MQAPYQTEQTKVTEQGSVYLVTLPGQHPKPISRDAYRTYWLGEPHPDGTTFDSVSDFGATLEHIYAVEDHITGQEAPAFLRSLTGSDNHDDSGQWWEDPPDLDNLPPPPPALLERDDGQTVIPADRLTTIYGNPKGGKTWVANLTTVNAVTVGNRVILVDYEMNKIDTFRRLRLLGGYPECGDITSFRYLYGPNLNETRIQEAAEWLGEQPGSLAIIDSVNRAGGYADRPDAFGDWLKQHVAPFRRLGAAVLLIDHTNKTRPAHGDNFEGPSGTGQQVGDVDIMLKVEGTCWTREQDGTITLKVIADRHSDYPGPERIADLTGTTRDGAFGIKVHKPVPAPIQQSRGQGSRSRRLKRLEKALVWIRKHDKPVTAYDLCAPLGVTKNTARGYLEALASSGELVKTKDGLSHVFTVPDNQGILTLEPE